MHAILLLLGLIAILVFLGALEYGRHRSNLNRLHIRVHINGTRGKSSVTRLVTWALNEAGIKTFGKTTGTLPRMIFPDGREYPVYRPAGHANVLEQLRILAVARAHNAQAVVIECMALQPRLQWLSEEKLVRSTHGIITNAREDHLDVMGPAEQDVALALAGMVPRGHYLFTAEQRNLDIFKRVCADRQTTLVPVTTKMVESVSDEDMSGFSYEELKDNVATVLALCKQLGIERETAIRGMWKVTPDAGALKRYEIEFFGRRLYFINGFAANDPESTERIWQMAREKYPDAEKYIAVFNCRSDRQQRSQQLAHAYAGWPRGDAVILMGSGTFVFAKEAAAKGVDSGQFMYAEGANSSTVFESVLSLTKNNAVVVGMGNIAGPGLELVGFFRNRCKLSQLEVNRW